MDDYRVPTLALLCILVAVFAALYVRSRTPRTLLWLIGWVLAVVRLAVSISAFGQQGIGLAISNAALELAALMFLGSVSTIKGKARFYYIGAFAAPLILLSVTVSLYPSPGIFLRILNCLATIAVVAVAVPWSTRTKLLPVWFTLLFTLCIGGACLYFAFTGDYDRGLRLAHSGISLMTALLVLVTYRRLSPGVIFTATGLVMWSTPMLIEAFLDQGDPVLVLIWRAVNLMKVMAAMGMIVLVLEDELTLNEAARMRDRRARAEMEQYSKLDISVTPNRDFGIDYDRVCQVITTASRFGQAAVLLRSLDQNFRVVGRGGMEGALAGALDALGQRLTPEKLDAFCKSSHSSVELGNTAVVDLRPLLVPGDDLERLNFVHIRSIPIGTHPAGLQGVLVLSGLKFPDQLLAAEDLLPLELLVARLAAGYENNLLLRRVMQSEKLAGLGQLAGRVAHELNNPLTVVMGYAELLEESGLDEPTLRSVKVIHSESRRMKQTVESLARFWKSSPNAPALISVEQMLTDIERLRKPELERAGIALEVAIARDLPRIRANGDQMRQVFLQLLNNAVTALQPLPPGQEKKIRIDATLIKDRVQVLFSDTGPGFPNPNRVFDPFFSTKKPGEGPGLGLSLCYSIVRDHSGEISAFNLHPRGAAVAIELRADVAWSEGSATGAVFSR